MNTSSPRLFLYALVIALFIPVSALAWSAEDRLPRLIAPQYTCHSVSSENEEDKKEILVPKEESEDEEEEEEEPDCD